MSELVETQASNSQRIPTGWEVDLVDGVLSRIIDYRGKTPSKTESGIPLITAKNVRNGYVEDEPREYISELAYDSWMTRGIPEQGDVLFTTEAPLANVAQITSTRRLAFAQRVIILQTNGRMLSEFLKYLLMAESIRERVFAKGTGSTVEGIKQSVFRRIPIAFPESLPEQPKIARILTTLDELIEKTEALIAKYQAIKQGMMHDLFTRGVDEHGHLRPTYDEVPELYKESELGWIPKEWSVDRVGDHLDGIEQGWSPDCDSEPASTGEWGVLKTTAVVWDGFNWIENKRLPTHLLPLQQYEVHVDDVLMTRGGPNSRVGVVAIVRETREHLMLSDKIYRLIPKKSLVPAYLALALSSERTQTHLSTLKTGLAESQTNISQEIVRRLWIGVPNQAEQRQVCKRIDAIDAVVHTQRKGLTAFQVEKTGLMQDLLTGEVRVKPDQEDGDV